MHRAGGKQPVDGVGIRRFHPDPARQLGTQHLGRPGGQDGAVELAAGVGQGGLHRMEAINPSFPALPDRPFGPWGMGELAPVSGLARGGIWPCLAAVFGGAFWGASGAYI